ncbi:hypothetical protein J2X04_001514 [Lysobacter niabensis]|uniref:Uncharacterized protein n=1 Tax=Agrilutibacter niabensis TaxID=380628 RepID=A0ABU1VNX7_9GAMM|nr:hypothetical protein [Lysobacter niabensis]MDR7099167.1 hypothetical protein [Lysobacter niabensis]
MSKLDAELLMNGLLPFAEQMLSEFGEFHPFGGYLDRNKEIVHVSVLDEQSSAKEKIEFFKQSFSQLAENGEALAFGIVFDVIRSFKDGSKGDAIKMVLEHKDGYCANLFFRYRIQKGTVDIIETIAQRGTPLFFGIQNEKHGSDNNSEKHGVENN